MREDDTAHVAAGVADAVLLMLGCPPEEVTASRQGARRLAAL
ncbi:hypothetical protein JIX56_05975 [Streptomyces sp. CA-210063]|nr:hypothetical protein [Streptomyces sp. CA-210063]UUU29473.1 hypothetical protein JIX56_05975 [Streptomyces sp. CA-210063]